MIIRSNLTLSEYTSLKSLIEKEILNKGAPQELDKEQLKEVYDNMSKELDANPVLNVLNKD